MPDLEGFGTGIAVAQPGEYWNSAEANVLALGMGTQVYAYKGVGEPALSTWSCTTARLAIYPANDACVRVAVTGIVESAKSWDANVHSDCIECGKGDDEPFTVVKVISIEAEPDVVCVGNSSIAYTITTQPEGYEFMVQWTPADVSTPGVKEVVATCGTSSATCTVTVLKVDLDHDLWWFDGANAANYDESGTLTAQGVSSGTFQWDVVAGQSKVTLNNGGADSDSIAPVANDNTVTIKSTDASAPPGDDVTIRLTYNGVPVCEKKLSVFAPASVAMLPGFPTYTYGSGLLWRWWVKVFKFQIYDQFNNALANDVEGNEKFGAYYDQYPGENWSPETATGVMGASGTLTDQWGFSGGILAFTPTLLNRTDPDASTVVYRVPHEYRVGSTTVGAGRLVESHTIKLTRGEAIIE